jgi:Bacterial Ig-like domain (group 1)
MDKMRRQRVITNLCKAKVRQPVCRQSEPASQRSATFMKIVRALVIAMAFILPAFAPHAARAQSQQEPTQISVNAPAQSNVGQRLTVQAVLVDNSGSPIPKATVYFTTQAEFLHNSGDVVLAQAVTNNKGQAIAHFTDDFSGTITLQAEFRGDAQYASSNTTTQIDIAGQNQVYAEHVGVNIPGFNVPPGIPPMASVQLPELNAWHFIANLWPAMNAWPIAAALIIVWSLYLVAVSFVFRIATSKNEDKGSAFLADQRRSL